MEYSREELDKLRRLKELKAKESPEFFGASVIEPVLSVGSGLAAAVGGGLSGMAVAANPNSPEGAGVDMVESFQRQVYEPKTEAGQAGLQKLGDLAQKGIDIVNFPISGLAGLTELLTGQGFDQAANTVRAVQDDGAGVTAGNRIFEETGSPLAATAAHVLPEGIAEVMALKGGGAATRGAARGAETVGRAVGDALPAIKDTFSAAMKYQTPTKQKIGRLIEEGSTDIETARFMLDDAVNTVSEVKTPTSVKPRGLLEYLETGAPKVKKDAVAVTAINQGFDEGVIAAIKGTSPTDAARMLDMVDIMEKGKKNARFSMLNRPSDIAGDALLDRFRVIMRTNKDAGTRLDGVAQSLRGETVDASNAINSFYDDLDAMGVTIGANKEVVFTGSDIEGLAAPEAAVRRIVARVSENPQMDAYEAHRLKKFIDENVTFGRSGEGLSGRTENVLKDLRRNLDTSLDETFDAYNEVNTTYAETISAIDSLQGVAGKKMNLVGDNSDKAVGTLLRRMMSNTQSRVNLLDAVNEIEAISKKYGGEFEDDILAQVLFADELDAVFGAVARTSFQGQIAQAIPRSATDAAIKVGEAAVEKIRAPNQEAAFKSIRQLLEQTKKRQTGEK